ncbi:flagellar biosynthesis protein FlhB [Aliibacillus thermotolerans]|uniref:Flagellar biosynthetic protein FlhB n=1 Tax=Aliibacillus thermotolerans TaxID=1834418 RepID=A0ABW0U5R5_9BACI|nr:flagellar biosynthesis protein FlhB [Aliibacillus thermotolerans]MDA3130598.1 flagellar biosynthesis protein FlhB [Aliibacillus thermotolerans]
MKWKVNLQYFSQEKTEKATPKKRQDTRKKGQVAKSTDVNTALILFAVFLFLFFYAEVLGTFLFSMLRQVLTEYITWDINEQTIPVIFEELAFETALILFPIMLIAVIFGVGASVLQVGFMFTPEVIKFKLEKVNPLKGLKRIFSLRALVEFLKSMLKITLVGILVFAIIWFHLDSLLFLSQKDLMDGFGQIASLTGMIGISVALLLLLLSIPDYMYQKYDHEKQIRMSKQEVKDEHKKMEGDPLIKSKRKKKQMDMAMQRMMQEVPEADVIITNPTHFAIALKYEEEHMDAPKVMAKGADFVALRMKTLAKKHNVIQVENKPLARALYEKTEIGDEVPEELFQAVAEVLAYVYRLRDEQG